jgi:DNA-binding helix-hairpin-helix protein with protein kinase domain
MVDRVFDAGNRGQRLGAELGRGGEGSVHALVDRPDLAVKLYALEKLHARGPELRRKVEAQIALWPALQHQPLAWPRLSVFDADEQWIGYAMRRGAGQPLRKLAHPSLSAKYFPGLTRRFITGSLLELLACVQTLHGQGIHLGDVNLNNFLCDPATGRITLIDCDSFQVATRQAFFPCPVGSQESTPPEHLGQDFARIRRTAESDAFSLAIMIFQCLMLGRHPYDSVGGCNPVDNLREGHFPYGEGGTRPGSQGAIPEGPWYLLWSHLSGGLKAAFIRAFRDGAHDPQARPGVAEWHKLLKQYLYSIGQGWLTDELRPAAPKPRGERRSALI